MESVSIVYELQSIFIHHNRKKHLRTVNPVKYLFDDMQSIDKMYNPKYSYEYANDERPKPDAFFIPSTNVHTSLLTIPPMANIFTVVFNHIFTSSSNHIQAFALTVFAKTVYLLHHHIFRIVFCILWSLLSLVNQKDIYAHYNMKLFLCA